ncbi:MAG: restriction endonuclease subunit S [Candidatus Microsaccharimonas sp.]
MRTVKIRDILKLEYGKPLDPADRTPDGKYPAFGANGVKSKTNKFYYDKPSIIVGRKGSAGELTLTYEKFWPLDVTYYVTHDDSETDLVYIYYLLKSLDITSYARGVKPGINRNDIYELTITLPPLTVQRNLGQKLSEAYARIDETIDLTKKNILNSSLLKESAVEEQFGHYVDGDIMSFGDVCEVKGGKRVPKGEKLISVATEHPYIRVTDFNKNGGVDTTGLRYVSEGVFSKIKKYTISNNDVYLSIAGTIGVTGVIPGELDGSNLTENACKLVPSSAIEQMYLYYFTQSANFKEQVSAMVKQSAQPKLALIRIRQINIPLPSVNEQRRAVANLDHVFNSIDKVIDLQSDKLRNLQKLKDSMLGQIIVNGVE